VLLLLQLHQQAVLQGKRRLPADPCMAFLQDNDLLPGQLQAAAAAPAPAGQHARDAAPAADKQQQGQSAATAPSPLRRATAGGRGGGAAQQDELVIPASNEEEEDRAKLVGAAAMRPAAGAAGGTQSTSPSTLPSIPSPRTGSEEPSAEAAPGSHTKPSKHSR
jgi:hypothetical protein